MNIKRLCRTALLLAVALILNYIEHSLPPLPYAPPGASLGLANIIIMYCLMSGKSADGGTIAILKSVFVLLTRGLTAFMLSLGGTLISFMTIYLLLKIKKPALSYVMLSICGAVVHNMIQLVISSILLYTAASMYYAPVLIIYALITGTVTGILLKILLPPLLKIEEKLK